MVDCDWLKHRIRKWITPRPNTDMESEILNIVSAPIYVYTITSVYYYSWFYIMPYHYSNLESVNDNTEGEYESDPFSLLYLHRTLLTVIYFEMMTNWLCIRHVSNNVDMYIEPTRSHTANSNEHKMTSYSQTHEMGLSYVNENQSDSGNREQRTISTNMPQNGQRRSYWSWNYCRKCGHDTPPRCHHCPMCETCILKRDHHCFFSGRCVGFYNQRYFIVFLIWAVFGTTYSTLYFLPYLMYEVWKVISVWDLFPPFALIRWLAGFGSGFITGMMFSYLFNFLFIFLSLIFLIEQYNLVCSGLTQFETKGLNSRMLIIVDPRDFGEKVRAVMGKYYGISLFFVPMHRIYPPSENPYDWPKLKIHRGNGKHK